MHLNGWQIERFLTNTEKQTKTGEMMFIILGIIGVILYFLIFVGIASNVETYRKNKKADKNEQN